MSNVHESERIHARVVNFRHPISRQVSLLSQEECPVECSSYRPISTLNVDGNILAKYLARRLENNFPSIISKDQTGFIKNLYSYFNICCLLDILYTRSGQNPECILCLDGKKAFNQAAANIYSQIL